MDDIFKTLFEDVDAVVREGFCGLGVGDEGNVVSSLKEFEAMRDEEGMEMKPRVSLGRTQYPGCPSSLFQLQSSVSSLRLTCVSMEGTTPDRGGKGGNRTIR